jgi:Lrp/AsnC family leucine-responsive transcriptional regulator
LQTKLDETDWLLLRELQRDARQGYAELARAAGMSAPAVADRVKRLEEAGIIRGYRADLDLPALGLPVLAFIRLRYPKGDYSPFDKLVRTRPEILECHHVTGEDCFVMKIACASMEHLERVAGALAQVGATTTSVVFSTRMQNRALSAETAGKRPRPARRR